MLDWLTFDNKGSGCEGLTIPPFISMLRRDHISIFVTPSPQRYWSSPRFLDSLTMPSNNHHYIFLLIPGFDHSLHLHWLTRSPYLSLLLLLCYRIPFSFRSHVHAYICSYFMYANKLRNDNEVFKRDKR